MQNALQIKKNMANLHASYVENNNQLKSAKNLSGAYSHPQKQVLC